LFESISENERIVASSMRFALLVAIPSRPVLTATGMLLVRLVNTKAIEHLPIILEQVGLSWTKVHPHSISQESDGGGRLNNSLRMVHPVALHTLLQTFEKMDVSAHTSDLKDKDKAVAEDERLHLDVVSSLEDSLEKLTRKNFENCLESMVT
jgi:hypothetical protein